MACIARRKASCPNVWHCADQNFIWSSHWRRGRSWQRHEAAIGSHRLDPIRLLHGRMALYAWWYPGCLGDGMRCSSGGGDQQTSWCHLLPETRASELPEGPQSCCPHWIRPPSACSPLLRMGYPQNLASSATSDSVLPSSFTTILIQRPGMRSSASMSMSKSDSDSSAAISKDL